MSRNRRLPRLLAAAGVIVVSVLWATGPAVAASRPPRSSGAEWTVASNGLAMTVPASWRVLGPGTAECPTAGGSVYVDQPAYLPAASCPLVLTTTEGTMVSLGQIEPGVPQGPPVVLNGLRSLVTLSTSGPVSATAIFPEQGAEASVSSFGPEQSRAARMAALASTVKILDTVRRAPAGYPSLPLPTGPPLSLRVTSVRPGLAPYDPGLGAHGVPVELVRFRLARPPTSGFVCQTSIRRRGKVVGTTFGSYAPTTSGQGASPGALAGNETASLQVSGPTFHGQPSEASVVCRPD